MPVLSRYPRVIRSEQLRRLYCTKFNGHLYWTLYNNRSITTCAYRKPRRRHRICIVLLNKQLVKVTNTKNKEQIKVNLGNKE